MRTDRNATAIALALAKGVDGLASTPVVPWSAVRQAALRERLAPLAWIRSGRFLRSVLDENEVAAWRSAYQFTTVRASRQLDCTHELTRELYRAGIDGIVIKGIPLSVQLYGDIAARPTDDVDMFVPLECRSQCRALLLSAGWKHIDGQAPWDETYLSPSSPPQRLEVHSQLLHPRFGYLDVPAPRGKTVVIDARSIVAHDDNLLPAYLAAHLASHQIAPLLWFLDFETCWAQLGQVERQRSRDVAQSAGLERYLEWAVHRSGQLTPALRDPRRLRLLGFRRSTRMQAHPIWRHLWLTPRRSLLGEAISAWAFPPWVSERPYPYLNLVRRALRYAATAAFPSSVRFTAIGQPLLQTRVVEGSLDAILPLVRQAIERGSIWVRLWGHSMMPTVFSGEEVLLTRVDGKIHVGDILLTTGPDGPRLHRVASLGGTVLTTRGDANRMADGPVERSGVLARAVAVRAAGRVIALRPVLDFGLAAFLRYVARYSRRLLWVAFTRASELKRIGGATASECLLRARRAR